MATLPLLDYNKDMVASAEASYNGHLSQGGRIYTRCTFKIVKIDDILPTQHLVSIDGLWNILRHGSDSDIEPFCTLYKGSLFVWNGHHRLILLKLLGQRYTLIRVFDPRVKKKTYERSTAYADRQ
jgi:hypothetical protein